MKRSITIFLLLSLFTFYGYTQEISVLVGLSRITGEPSWKSTFGGQVTLESKLVKFNQESSFNGGIGFSLQGSSYEEDYFSGKVTATYLIIPLLYSYRNPGGFYAEAGLQPAILLSAKDKYDGESYDYKDYMKSFDLGIPVGAGYIIQKRFGVGVRVIPALTKNHKDGNSRNFVAFLRLFYIFNKSKNNKN